MNVQYHDHDYPFEELLPVGQAFEKQLAAGTTTTTSSTPIISWEIFHSRHDQGKFFKLKRYLVAEFPDVLAMDTEETVLLDVGCGNGAALVPFLRVTDHLRAVAFDCSASAIKILRSFVEDTPNEERVQTHVCDLMSNPIPLSDASVDVALLIFILSAVPVDRMPDVLSEVHRVLRPGSLLCFRDYGVYDLTHLRSTNEQWLGGKTFLRGDEKTMVTFFDLDMLRTLFVQCGFVVEELKYALVEVTNRKQARKWRRCFVHAKVRTIDTKVGAATREAGTDSRTPSMEVPSSSITSASASLFFTTNSTTNSTTTNSTTNPASPSSTLSPLLTPSVHLSSANSLDESLLSVRLSQIGAIAGDGLYIERGVAMGETVCVYTGDVYATHEAMRLEDKSYLMRLGEQCYVDAAQRLDVKARYINDCRHSLLYNVRFDKRPSENHALVVAVRDISAGEELFVDYGWKYWLSIKGKRLSPTIAARILSDLEGKKIKVAGGGGAISEQ